MRPPRIAILVLFLAAFVFLLCRAVTSVSGTKTPVVTTPTASAPNSGLRSFFSLSAPFTLFPPNAIITIADDNSTSFAARPAAFGPRLEEKGLTGQLWIGSGFTEEKLGDSEAEGELGCSDVPGWDDGSADKIRTTSIKEVADKSRSANSASKNQKRDSDSKGPMVDRTGASSNFEQPKLKARPKDDGTDDYLQEGLEQSQRSGGDASGVSSSSHADIQSIQEGAEIAGKIVLLSRGGCGFLEKVKWAQRRGALGLIVGDNQRGGPLIQMFARGDTSNVTIPSIFTSRTTAYLLSLMMQPDDKHAQAVLDENGRPIAQAQPFRTTTATATPKATAVSKSSKSQTTRRPSTSSKDSEHAQRSTGNWFTRLFRWRSASDTAEKSRPPSSGQHEWVLIEDFSDGQDKIIKSSLDKASKSGKSSNSKSTTLQTSGDSFQIGVQDWRDPDLVGSPATKDKTQSSTTNSKDSNNKEETSSSSTKSDTTTTTNKKDDKNAKDPNGPKGGSITPGSGEYNAEDLTNMKGKPAADSKTHSDSKSSGRGGLLSKLFGEDDGADFVEVEPRPAPIHTPIVEKPAPGDGTLPPPGDREGLWIVITPSSGASPFFDTLLVLVISPLITLTVVYALLILRARIRRRRWRAPKSVVDRLPVRTFHTVPASTPSLTPRLPSPAPPSPTTPLLQSQQSSARPRPRSRTTTGIPSAGDLLHVDTALQVPQPQPQPHRMEKSQWKKYMGRQVECVVCLEEYVDGVSQVMSLPCGHEFHVECITPWLTTRRRTCPICKGDVVRSLARGSPSSPRYEPYRDDSDSGDDFFAHSSRSSSANRSPLRNTIEEEGEDVEQGLRRTRRQEQGESWFDLLANGLRGTPREGDGRQSPEGRRER